MLRKKLHNKKSLKLKSNKNAMKYERSRVAREEAKIHIKYAKSTFHCITPAIYSLSLSPAPQITRDHTLYCCFSRTFVMRVPTGNVGVVAVVVVVAVVDDDDSSLARTPPSMDTSRL
jgi:hypothetical protein